MKPFKGSLQYQLKQITELYLLSKVLSCEWSQPVSRLFLKLVGRAWGKSLLQVIKVRVVQRSVVFPVPHPWESFLPFSFCLWPLPTLYSKELGNSSDSPSGPFSWLWRCEHLIWVGAALWFRALIEQWLFLCLPTSFSHPGISAQVLCLSLSCLKVWVTDPPQTKSFKRNLPIREKLFSCGVLRTPKGRKWAVFSSLASSTRNTSHTLILCARHGWNA